ncbi:MAG: hypothetical protein ACREOH_05665, partial [Candidatus Entotheonellia bacterium]
HDAPSPANPSPTSRRCALERGNTVGVMALNVSALPGMARLCYAASRTCARLDVDQGGDCKAARIISSGGRPDTPG